ncbi:MAG: hypothetical protein ABDH28_04935 [Brevinematia bacterium]
MKECVLITSPPINVENLLCLSEGRSFHEIYVGGRFKIIDLLIGNFERVGVEDFVIVVNSSSSNSLSNYLELAWNSVRVVVVSKVNDNFKLEYSNFNVSQFNKFSSEASEVYFDIENFLYQNYRKVFWAIGYPIWFPIEEYYDGIKNLSIALLYSKVGSYHYYHTGAFSQRYISEVIEAVKLGTFNSFFHTYREHNSYEVRYFLFLPFSNLREYFRMNLGILDLKVINEFETLFGKFPIRCKSLHFTPAVIGKHGKFSNSLVGDSSFVDGSVENSIICPNVKIERDGKIRNAIVFPGNWIGKNVEINNVIIDECTVTLKFPNIGDECILGGKGIGAPNTKYPSIMNFDATLIGKNVILPRKIQVSLNAYIPSNTDVSKLRIGRYIKSSTVF